MKLPVLLLSLTCAPLAMAELPPNYQLFGTVQATIDHCAEVAPQIAPKVRHQASRVFEGVAEADLTALREGEAYKRAYASARDALGKASPEDSAAACGGLVEPEGH